ncbi:MAG: Hsp20/alpha crystallin family protein [Solitalea-like symbiont of Acarus siro]
MRLINYNSSLADKFMQHVEPIINPTRMTHPTNIIEKEKSFIIEISAPGFDKKDFQIMIKGTYLIVSGQINSYKQNNKEIDSKNDAKYIQKEFINQNFEKSFSLGTCSIEEKSIKASYEKGILSITVNKKPEDKDCSRNIKVD